jgi:hypothetical protein
MYYFDELIDQGYDIFGRFGQGDIYVELTIKKVIPIENIDIKANDLIDIMIEIVDRLKHEGFKSKFILYLNNVPQQIENPNSVK